MRENDRGGGAVRWMIGELAGFLARLQPDAAYLSIPTPPPAKQWVRAPEEQALNRACQLMSERVHRVE
jgi:wyosine [tRNA(Phe)-imidazoG37] synthetase (radical SAM superfamily)